jgi:TonB family protein
VDKQYYDENGEALSDTTNNDREAFYEDGPDAYTRKISNYFVYPPGQYIENSEVAAVVVTFTVDEEGNVVEPYVLIPFEDAFNKAALRAVKNSPKWHPAIGHNRRVKSEYTRSFRFYNSKEALEEEKKNEE